MESLAVEIEGYGPLSTGPREWAEARGQGHWNQDSLCCYAYLRSKQKIWVSRVITLTLNSNK